MTNKTFKKCSEKIRLHSKRTRDIALVLQEFYGGDEEVISISALLHDIAIDEKFETHAEEGAKIVRKIFGDKLDSVLLEKVCYCIKHHSIASPKPPEITLELVCVYDADKMDFLLTTSPTNYLYNRILKSFLGEKSSVLYKKLERTIKWYKK